MLVVVAEHDEVVARSHTENLIAAFPASQVQVEVIEGATHNSIDLFPAYGEKLAGFFATR